MGNKGDPISSLDFKEAISSSNEITEDVVKVNISSPLLFSTTLNFEQF